MQKFFAQLIGFLIILTLVVAGRYFYYVEFEGNPNSEVGAALHSLMPDQIKSWGCERLRARFQFSPGCG
jgi:hypothetical protein